MEGTTDTEGGHFDFTKFTGNAYAMALAAQAPTFAMDLTPSPSSDNQAITLGDLEEYMREEGEDAHFYAKGAIEMKPGEPSTSAAAFGNTTGDSETDGPLPTNPKNPLRALVITPYEPCPSNDFTPTMVLEAFGQEWGMKTEYNVRRVVNPRGPSSFACTLTMGFRTGEGSGATRSQAKEDAAANILNVLMDFVPADRNLKYKPVVKTDPAKDILYVLKRTCIGMKLKLPKYRFEAVLGKETLLMCTISLGELIDYGVHSKKSVAARIAAVKLYTALRELFNQPAKIPNSIKKVDPAGKTL